MLTHISANSSLMNIFTRKLPLCLGAYPMNRWNPLHKCMNLWVAWVDWFMAFPFQQHITPQDHCLGEARWIVIVTLFHFSMHYESQGMWDRFLLVLSNVTHERSNIFIPGYFYWTFYPGMIDQVHFNVLSAQYDLCEMLMLRTWDRAFLALLAPEA